MNVTLPTRGPKQQLNRLQVMHGTRSTPGMLSFSIPLRKTSSTFSGFGNAEQSRSEQSKSEAKLHKLSTENQRLMEVHKKTPIHVSEASTR